MFWCCLISGNECSAIKISRLRSSDDGAKRYQNFATLTYFDAPHHYFAFLISNFSFKRSFHPQSKGDTPQGRTLNPFPSI